MKKQKWVFRNTPSYFTFQSKVTKNNKGFTLIELLVVITIIGILASAVLASLDGARTAARESIRTSDIKSVVTALELFRNQNNRYPVSPTDIVALNTTHSVCGGATYCLAIVTQMLVAENMLTTLPTDPRYGNTGSNYRYCGNAQVYTIIRYSEVDNRWCLPAGLPAIHTGCGAVDNRWYTYPAC